MSLYIDVHVLQTVPPSNLNRDDTGSPKTAIYGGVRRARVSSQAWKRATRRDFSQYLDPTSLGVRTKRAVELLTMRLRELSPGLDTGAATELAIQTLKAAGLKVTAGRKAKDGGTPLTEYLVFFSNLQLERLAALAAESQAEIDSKAVKAVLKDGHSVDVALFGRMVADAANLNVDAACQVSHALSTHAVTTEFDYYTAVDDKNPAEETGAGMIGTVEFDSATLYRYATVDVAALRHNLGEDEATARATEAFVRSFTLSMPTGKQNTFANRTIPDAVVVMVRTQRPVNLVGAFESAVKGHEGYVTGSCGALANYAKKVDEAFGGAPTDTWISRVGRGTDALAVLGETLPFDELVSRVGERVRTEQP